MTSSLPEPMGSDCELGHHPRARHMLTAKQRIQQIKNGGNKCDVKQRL
ncbi:rCG50599, isoform CRA_c [Rattus norvegicus]|uniref:RCG50599, isoform CRA_c n=1 Tax=Rattus norvegicus TaxID=10116 RepID=A6KC79_RAT|nr:rCG50599, isoform CRA_c [Rattus norvegicus]